MKKHRKWMLFAAAMAVLIGLFAWLGRKPINLVPGQARSSSSLAAPTAAVVSPSPQQEEGNGYRQITVKERNRTEAVHEANERLRLDPRAPGKTPLSFYGQVVDEQGQPIAGVQVRLRWPDYRSEEGSSAQRTTDAQGRFSLVGEHSDRLLVFLDKPGYAVPLEVKKTSFEFFQPGNEAFGDGGRIFYYEPDEAQPFVFRLHKKGGSTKLIHRLVYLEPPADGTPASFDFVRGVLVADGGGQMSIQAWKKVDRKFPFYPFDWRVTLRMAGNDGSGFREDGAKEEFAFQAPDGGYEPARDWAFHATSSLAGGNSGLITHFYFCCGEPKCYGRVKLTTRGTSQTIELDYVFNPTPGDRNLEYNPDAKE